MNISELELSYQKYVQNLSTCLPEGIISIDLPLLQRLDLLNYDPNEVQSELLTHYFHVIETQEKITLYNDDFVVWIIPEILNNTPVTYTLVALRRGEETQIEVAFSSTGIYNTSKMVLRVLEKLLIEIKETEKELKNMFSPGKS